MSPVYIIMICSWFLHALFGCDLSIQYSQEWIVKKSQSCQQWIVVCQKRNATVCWDEWMRMQIGLPQNWCGGGCYREWLQAQYLNWSMTFRCLCICNTTATTPMLLSGERVAMRMLKFILVARITATLSKQAELDASDYGVRSARRRSCLVTYYAVGGPFTDT